MSEEDTPPPPRRVLWPFPAIPLGILLLLFVTWSLRDFVLVAWVGGNAAYTAGLRVLPGKPTRFSDGQPAPSFPDFITGLLAFSLAMATALTICWLVHRIYERMHSRRAN